uniref:Uncharacterized protein n=1 Tax=Globodera rostochiensis TaxID=31243 RepID=A0A914HPZ2_GLORO
MGHDFVPSAAASPSSREKRRRASRQIHPDSECHKAPPSSRHAQAVYSPLESRESTRIDFSLHCAMKPALSLALLSLETFYSSLLAQALDERDGGINLSLGPGPVGLPSCELASSTASLYKRYLAIFGVITLNHDGGVIVPSVFGPVAVKRKSRSNKSKKQVWISFSQEEKRG